MKKSILLIMLLLMTPLALADYWGDFNTLFGEKKEKKIEVPCGESIFQSQLVQLNENEIFLESISTFDDGTHIVQLTGSKFEGAEYLTIKKDTKVTSINKGYCATKEFKKYKFFFDLEQIKQVQETQDAKGAIKEAYKIINGIEGVTFFQKVHIIKTILIKEVSNVKQFK
tara:strand:- start:109 stop:618 length:510 start_codon:yes stop_codon:yes gene_type:complete